eukprot:TRINITY_DN1025_c0_g2_i1.p1 TRINITY_DN1025_c0_g2~~TRINITY_DN1025_c0_g2_i1.p1  ORF type:complete len:153 (+),score=34.15 TRINITY_DN1025_c0_g2_i1:861-1319(+)
MGSTRLTQDEIDECKTAFDKYDKDGSGSIDVWELRNTLIAMGQQPTEEEVFKLLSEADEDGSGTIEFPEFLNLIAMQKADVDARGDEGDIVDGFVALGGNPDKSGEISSEKLSQIVKMFQLTIDIDQLIKETDTDGSGFIDYDEFKAMMLGD